MSIGRVMLLRRLGAAAAFILVSACHLLAPPGASAVANYSIDLPVGTYTVMGNTSAILSFLVTNDASSTRNIRAVRFSVLASLYRIDEATAAPTGWQIKSMGTTTVCIVRATGGIAPGSDFVFDIVLTGPGGGSIASDTQDMTDSLDMANTMAKDAKECGPGFTALSTPTWTRKALSTDLIASPISSGIVSAGVGDTITLTLQVINSSTISQSLIVPTYDPPSPYYFGIATLTDFLRSTDTTINVSSTDAFSSSGTMLIDSELITYTGITATSFTGCTRATGGTTASYHANGTSAYNRVDASSLITFTGGPTPSDLTLASGDSATIVWTLDADATGNMYFSTAAENSTPATSAPENSNQVVIGDFTAVVSVEPLAVIDGQDVTVTMIVTNNGNSALGNVSPTLLTGGTATATLLTGPTPSSITSLSRNETGTFTWTYDISGSSGGTFFFYGNASAGSNTSNTSVSESGSVTVYTVTVTPDSLSVGSTDVTLTWTLYNNGAEDVKLVKIPLPSGWVYTSATAGNWSVSYDGTSVTFTAGTNLPVLSSKVFEIVFSSIPDVMSDTDYTFPLQITDKKNNEGAVDSLVIVTSYVMSLSYSPSPGPIDADGVSFYTLTATITRGGSPVVGVALDFTATIGTFFLTTNTDATGTALAYLTPPCAVTDISDVTINAQYLSTEDPQVINSAASPAVAYAAVSTGNLVYVGGSLSPSSVDFGDNVTLTVDLLNCGAVDLTVNPAGTSLSFYTDIFALDSTVTITAGIQATLSFTSTITSVNSLCTPELIVDAVDPSLNPYVGNFSTATDLDDQMLVDAASDCVLLIPLDSLDWHELY